jgi:predicted PolB exonuclease-like 3'-5' exonuclease
MGRIKEVAEYCETDIVNTYRVWLRYELFRGGLSPDAYEQCEANLAGWISARAGSKQHLMGLIK